MLKLLRVISIILFVAILGLSAWIGFQYVKGGSLLSRETSGEQEAITESTTAQMELTTQQTTQKVEMAAEVLEIGDIRINEENFPDAAFRKWITDNYSTNNGVMKASEVKNIKAINLVGVNVKNLKGLERFSSLNHLSCDFEQLNAALVNVLDCEIDAYMSVPYCEVKGENDIILDYKALPNWNQRIEDYTIHYSLEDGTKKEEVLYGSSIVVPKNAKAAPYCEYTYTGKEKIKVHFTYNVSNSNDVVDVLYRSTCQDYGWLKNSAGGMYSGTINESKRLEGFMVRIVGNDNLSINYSAYCDGKGWLPEVKDGEVAGTEGESRRLEAVKINLSGSDAEKYDIYYRVFLQDNGWFLWAKNGEETGLIGYEKRIEAIQIVLLRKDSGDIEKYGKPWTEQLFSEKEEDQSIEAILTEEMIREAFRKKEPGFFRTDEGFVQTELNGIYFYIKYLENGVYEAQGRGQTGFVGRYEIDSVTGEVRVVWSNYFSVTDEAFVERANFNVWDYLD